MIETENKYKQNEQGLHLIIVCDEVGIFHAYYLLKNQLSGCGNTFLTLIYTVSDKFSQILFEQELSILEKRFPVNLIVLILKIDTTKYCFKQELIEAAINSNTLPIMKFSVIGNTEFVNYVSEGLRLLDVDAIMIHSKIIQYN